MDNAWFYAAEITTGGIIGWYAEEVFAWIKGKFNRQNDEAKNEKGK